jgi:hypothetical protein
MEIFVPLQHNIFDVIKYYIFIFLEVLFYNKLNLLSKKDVIKHQEVYNITELKKYIYKNNWSKILFENKNKIKEFKENIKIIVKDLSESHILHGQKGVFAINDIQVGDIIGEYVGIIEDIKNYKKNNGSKKYCIQLFDNYIINANDYGNEIRYINSYLNISDKPNCKFSLFHNNNLPHILCICINNIKSGEEILCSYSEEYNKEFNIEKI